MDEALDVLAADQRQIFAEFLAIEVEQPGAVGDFLFRHLVEHLGGGGELRAQALGKAAIDAAVLFLVGDGQRQYFLLGQVGKFLHVKRPLNRRLANDFYITILNTKGEGSTHPQGTAAATVRFHESGDGNERKLGQAVT
jgi:hypothetical protein